MTHILAPTPSNITLAAQHIRNGELVAFPTETVYGLGADALNAQAVEKIFIAKGRPTTDPLIVHIHDLAQLSDLAQNIPPLAYQLAEQFFPGALTLVLHKTERVPANVTAGKNTVAVRMPAHPIARALLEAAHTPIAAPSANLFARPSPTTAAHVLNDLDGRLDFILDGGETAIGVESTILNLTMTPPVILRPGGISLEQLAAACPDVVLAHRELTPHQAADAPGQFLKHYSPRAEMRVFTGDSARVIAAMRTVIQNENKRIGVLVTDALALEFSDLPVEIVTLGADLNAIAHNLFSALREIDSRHVQLILAAAPPREGIGVAIWDRLFRAAEGRVINADERRTT